MQALRNFLHIKGKLESSNSWKVPTSQLLLCSKTAGVEMFSSDAICVISANVLSHFAQNHSGLLFQLFFCNAKGLFSNSYSCNSFGGH